MEGIVVRDAASAAVRIYENNDRGDRFVLRSYPHGTADPHEAHSFIFERDQAKEIVSWLVERYDLEVTKEKKTVITVSVV